MQNFEDTWWWEFPFFHSALQPSIGSNDHLFLHKRVSNTLITVRTGQTHGLRHINVPICYYASKGTKTKRCKTLGGVSQFL